MAARQSHLERQNTDLAVQHLIDGKLTAFDLVTFKEYKTSHEGAQLKPKQYKKYLVLCHQNTKYHAGWMVCPYAHGRYCSLRKGLFSIDAKKEERIGLDFTC